MGNTNFGAPDPGAHHPDVPSGSYYPPYDEAPDPQPANHDLYYADINTHYVAISREEPETIKSAGDAWVQIGTALTAGAEAIRRRGITLSGKWEGAAKEAFLLKVGMLTSVLDDWAGTATANGVALRETLYPVVRDKRTAMAELWREYKGRSDDIREQENANASLGELWEDTKETFGGKDRLSANLEHYSQRARAEILDPMSAAFDTAFLALSTGAVYQGPKDAVVKTIDPSSLGGAPGSPGTPGAPAAPGAPGAPAAPPAAPPGVAQSLGVPTAVLIGTTGLPQRTADLDRLRDQVLQATRVPPTNPMNEQALHDVQQHLLEHLPRPEAPGAAPAPTFLPPAPAPGMLGARTAPAPPPGYAATSSGGVARGTAPTAPTLSRAAAPTAPGAAPGGSASGGRPAVPGVPGGLGGRTGAAPQAPAAMGRPGAGGRPSAAPGLGGRAAGKAPSAPSQRGFGASPPTLGGRATPAAPGLAGRPGPPRLDGRGAAPGRPARPAAGTRGLPTPLQGRPPAGRTDAPARPGTGRRHARATAPGPELGTGAKGAPLLGGRTVRPAADRQATVEAARDALRKSLRGRPATGAPATPGRRPQDSRAIERLRAARAAASKAAAARAERDGDATENGASDPALVGGTELFEPDAAGDGVVAARPPQDRVTRSGPAIGTRRA